MYNQNWLVEPFTSDVFNSLFNNISISSDTKDNSKNQTMHITSQSKDGLIYFKYKLPGYEKDQIKIEVGQPTISSTRSILIKAHNDEYNTTTYTSYIPKNIDEKLTKANLKNGILTLTFVPEKIKSPLANLKIEVE
jgi:HSP20 family molecular chaperone IbpA